MVGREALTEIGSWLKRELEKKGYEVVVPSMPNPKEPQPANG